jgi:hypothetical protein
MICCLEIRKNGGIGVNSLRQKCREPTPMSLRLGFTVKVCYTRFTVFQTVLPQA